MQRDGYEGHGDRYWLIRHSANFLGGKTFNVTSGSEPSALLRTAVSARYLVAHFAHSVRTAVSAVLMTGGRAVVLPLVRASRYVLSCSNATANRCAATAPQGK